MLKPGFKDMLPANDTILLDKTKPDELQVILNKNANTVVDWDTKKWHAGN